jgi:ribosomal protein S18 acetylase RimI-like enzyme
LLVGGVGGTETKLEQLYLLHELRGQGLGGAMLAHVEDEARARRCTSLMLTVNRNNAGSIAVYEKSGFVVREEAKSTSATDTSWTTT